MMIDYKDDPRAVLIHFNQNHDPETGRFTSKRAAGLANKIYNTAKTRIDNISNDVVNAADKSGSKMYGLEHRLKTKDSITRKILKNSHEDKVALDAAADNIKDAVRFTTISDERNFVGNYNRFKQELAKNGYSEIRCKNYFQMFREGKVKHKSVQSVFSTDDGYKFEVQFQTPASQDAKDKKVPLYEEVRKEGISQKRKKQIELEMEQLAKNVKDPVMISTIKSYG